MGDGVAMIDSADFASRKRRMAARRRRILACDECSANDPGITAAVAGYGSVVSPVALVGQAPAPKCVGARPFTEGSGKLIDAALEAVDLSPDRVFITNAVHCHLPDHRPPTAREIATHLPHLRDELDIVSPSLVIGLGKHAEKALRSIYPGAVELRWPFTTPSARQAQRLEAAGAPLLLFAPHPNRIRQWEPANKPMYVRRLASALAWAWRCCAP
ncbi:uracil-DNA glycosylase family protein [Mycolicibacter longobardus]|uniref:uracil-DNA glycosylase family protein n=1 Tax=Mycolicibacter longobardus TaxID=1108812 RepID=UPI000A15BAE8|nr:uracil-DNA glycosylase family protein [Mycolicibacter longobardus]MCV7383592.1 uracil-DNA glycosylase [Mycolicibacter longobardus]